MKRVEKNEQIVKEIEKEEKKPRTKRLIKLSIFFLILIFSSFYYMRFVETKMLFVKEIRIESPEIPKSFHGLKIVHFSDLHYKMTTGEKEMENILDKINELKADILVFTGDLLDSSIPYTTEDYNQLTEYLKKMNANISKYYVKGNHDYFTSEVDAIFQNADFISLNNSFDTIDNETNEKIRLIGFGSFLKNDFKVNDTYQNIPEENVYTIALFHEPDNIMELRGRTMQLALSGHSHNGQIHLPLISDLLKVEGAKTYYKNYYEVENTKLYINQGLGTSMYKLRLFAPPTINLYRLTNTQ